MSDVVLAAKGLCAGYGQLDVVKGIDLELRAGEVVALLGANGAGKTTTLLALSGALASTGQLTVMGSNETESLHRRVRRGMQFLPEERGVIRTLSVRDNLRLGGASIDRALELSPTLERLLDRVAGSLSGGEQQILALTRALALKPKLLLADELSFGLAPIVVSRMLQLARTAADAGAAVLIVEQYAVQALACADRAVVMRQGEVVLEGPADELAADLDAIEESYVRGTDTA